MIYIFGNFNHVRRQSVIVIDKLKRTLIFYVNLKRLHEECVCRSGRNGRATHAAR